MRRIATPLFFVLSLAYPLAVYLGLDRYGPRALACLLLGMAVLRALQIRSLRWLVLPAVMVGLALAASITGATMPLKLYPAMVNATLLLIFAASVLSPPTVVERIARMTDPALPPRGVAYTRKVTLVWCGFFAFNGMIALATALWASERIWALYNGLVAYLLMGVLFAGEWLVRRRVMAVPPHG